MEKHSLYLVIGVLILLVAVLTTWARMTWDWVGQLLLLSAIVITVWSLELREKKPSKISQFLVKSLVVSVAVTSIFWFGTRAIVAPEYFSYLSLGLLMSILAFAVLPASLVAVSLSTLTYGKFRVRLRAWEFFLSSWYVCVFAAYTIVQVWWAIRVQLYGSQFYYVSGAGTFAFDIFVVSLSFLVAVVLTIIYVTLGKAKSEPPP